MHFDCNLSNDSLDFLCFNKLVVSKKKFDDCRHSVEMIGVDSNRNLTRLRVHFGQ